MLTHMDVTLIPPVAQPWPVCAWCWYLLHPNQPFPETVSSSCCDAHGEWQQARVAVARGRACWLQHVAREVHS
jgi:hypothetical protein